MTGALALPIAAGPRRAEVEAALEGADVFFASLLFDFDQVGGSGGAGVKSMDM